MSHPFEWIVEADGPIRATDIVSDTISGAEVQNVEPLRRRGSSVQRHREGTPLWLVSGTTKTDRFPLGSPPNIHWPGCGCKGCPA